MSLIFRVTKGKTTYNAVYKNGLKSRKRNLYDGNSIKLESHHFTDSLGDENEILNL
jgi:hypothetical protein